MRLQALSLNQVRSITPPNSIFPEIPADLTSIEAIIHFCHRPGQGCSKVKRAAEAIAEALAQPEPEAEADAEPIRHFCHRPGQGCSKAKRAADELAKAAEEAVSSL